MAKTNKHPPVRISSSSYSRVAQYAKKYGFSKTQIANAGLRLALDRWDKTGFIPSMV
jgi:hypothetical protein